VTPVRCACGHRACRDWHVSPVADVQGVNFTERQARAVAHLLARMEAAPLATEFLVRVGEDPSSPPQRVAAPPGHATDP
jgi:hypothetical protein